MASISETEDICFISIENIPVLSPEGISGVREREGGPRVPPPTFLALSRSIM